MEHRKTVQTALGAAVWVVTVAALVAGINTIRARTARSVRTVYIKPGPGHGLAPGDFVFHQTASGLERAGEVSQVSKDESIVTLAIQPSVADLFSTTTHATCWRTPLSAEQAVNALFPPVVQRKVASQLTTAWRLHDEELARIWGPLTSDLASAYLAMIGDDLQAAIDRHTEDLWRIAQRHGEQIAVQWPIIQGRLRPILQEHLTPVLGRLIHDAVDHAPKMGIAWNVARGNSEQAIRHTLDSLSNYLAELPEEDRKELAVAVQTAWEAAGRDQALADALGQVGRAIIEDEELRQTLVDIYREAVTDNPRTETFFRTQILESPQFRAQLYEFMEVIGPTAQRVAATCLFDEQGATRPEVVHLVRSIALGRRVSWVTLTTVDPGGSPLPPGATLPTIREGSNS